jgi:hypothetical protein
MRDQTAHTQLDALTDETHPSRRARGSARLEALPGNGSRKDMMTDRLSRTPQRMTTDDERQTSSRRDVVDCLARLYCELGTATFDSVDGRLLSHQYQARRAALCTEIRRCLTALHDMRGTGTPHQDSRGS